MTKKLFEIDPYLKECMATIIEVKEIAGETWLVLDQTIFYPEGGGQPSDLGTIDKCLVSDVKIIEDVIHHKIQEQIDKTKVKLAIDLERRFDHMQQHTGQHLLSAVLTEMFGINTVSFHLGNDICTIDLNVNEISEQKIVAVETKVAEYIFENRTVESFALPLEEVEQKHLIKLKESPSFVRFIEIDGVDLSTCCGTHVSMLGELGLVKIVGWQKHKQNVRLSFICGKRALKYFREIEMSVKVVAKKLNVPTVLVGERFPDFYQNHLLLKKQFQSLYEKEIYNEAALLIEKSQNDLVEVRWAERPLQAMKDLAKVIIQTENKFVIFSSNSHNTWIFASSSSETFDVSNCIQSLKERFGGKGGGNSVFGQWTGTMSDEKEWGNLKDQWGI